ncbi:MAG: YheC/YheD family protein [Myxococcota bacterium]
MKLVGLLCNCTADENPKQQLSPSLLNRAFLIDELLAPAGIRVFLYSPKDVTPTGDVAGYVREDEDLVAARQPVPRVNANWTYATRRLLDQGMGYRRFKEWTRQNGIGIYVPYEFSELVSNKHKTYEAVRAYDEALHPHTEDFIGSSAQIESFLARSALVFVKPRAGNKGNRIFVLRRAGSEYSLKYYDTRALRSFPRITLKAALALVDVAAGEEHYVLQEGVESLRYQDAVFDVRVVMVHDGLGWHAILETIRAPPDSDLSNVFQGGSIRVTGELLASMLGATESHALEEQVRRVSHGLAEHLESLYPAALPEIGFDFVLDGARRLHLVEVNAKPGLAGIGSESKLFDWKAEEEPLHEVWSRPHAKHLAGFLRHKIEGG